MADNTSLSAWDQRNMEVACRHLAAVAGQILRTADEFKRAKDQFLALGLTNLIATNADADHVHGAGDAPTKQQLLDLSSLVDYLRAAVLSDGTVSSMTPAQARAILNRYSIG